MIQPDIANLTWHDVEIPEQPIVVVAFSGWNDAGDAATQALSFLKNRTDTVPLASLDPEQFFDFTVARPHVGFDATGQREITWPSTEFSVGHLVGSETPIIFLEGVEPQLQWRTFCDQAIQVAQSCEARMVVTLGALLADVPHTRPVAVHGTTENEELVQRLNLSASDYEGPTGIIGVLSTMCREACVPTASLWASVPSYVPGAGSPKAALALIERLQLLLDFALPTVELEIAAAAYERQVSELIADDDETAAYVSHLEHNYDHASPDEESGDALIEQLEDFLKSQD